MPERIQLRRTKGWRMPAGAVKVDRSTRHGNPFVVGDWVWINDQPRDGAFVYLRTSREHATEEYEFVETAADAVRLFRRLHELNPGYTERARAELEGKDLACWCALDAPCHADVWIDLVNAKGE